MKSSKIDRVVSVVVVGICLIKAVLYGGSKPPSTTNEPPEIVDGDAPTNAAPPVLMASRPRLVMSPSASYPSQSSYSSQSISNWTARGAYCDWQRIDFPDTFQFPVGTNFIDAVTLFAYGEVVGRGLRSAPEMESTNSIPAAMGLAALPARVSLEPNVSSVTHGLTPSNSYLFAWHNCCVERSATNRVNASIELFRNGAVATTVTPLSTPTPPTYTYQPAVPPAGFIGIGQDDDWIRATFPDEADTILAQGYDNWLLNTWTGINAENGHCLVRVTVAALPDDGSPCYLACGPYRVNVTQPGTYGFPIEVLTDYEVRTYPTPVPLTFEYDDGYRGEGGPSFEAVDRNHPAPTPRLMLAAPPGLLDCIYRLFVTPNIVVTPYSIALENAVNEELRFWCNLAHRASYTLAESSDEISLDIDGARAVIREVWCAGFYEVCESTFDEAVKGYFEIYGNSPTNENGYVTNRIDATIFSGESWHHEPLGDRRRSHHLTAVTQHGSTEPVTVSMSQMMAEGVSAYVAVYMASSEPDSNPAYDDSVSWSIASNGSGSFSGSASVMDNWSALQGAESWGNELYGVERDPLFLGGQMFAAPPDDVLRLSLTATAQNATDGLRETCVQIVVYPTDTNGNPIGLPTWVNQN